MASERRTSGFFRRYTMIMGLTYATLVAVAFALFLYQLKEREGRELERLGDRLREHALVIDTLALITTLRVETLGARVEELLAAARAAAGGPDGRTARDGVAATTATAVAASDGPSGATAGELDGLPRLEESLEAITDELPVAVRAFYVSARDLVLTSPPPENGEAGMWSRAVRARLFYQLGRPERNPERAVYWATEIDDRGEPHTICAVPVYTADPDRGGGEAFAGVAGIEASHDYFRRINADLNYEVGQTSLVDERGRVVIQGAAASPELVRELAAELPPRSVAVAGDAIGYQHRFTFVPWTMVYTAGRMDVLWPLVTDLGQQAIVLLVALTLMVLVASRLTRHEFIDPASRLVRHIAAAGELEGGALPRVPPTWQPWFAEVTRTFRESVELAALRQELDIAAAMQNSILPQGFRSVLPVEIHADMAPAKLVGGDFYDYFQLDADRIGVVIADVSGKGVPAGLFMMVSRTLLKSTAIDGVRPGVCLRRVNDLLCAENDSLMFVTVFYGIFDARSHRLVYANAGHNPPFVVRHGGEALPLPGLNGIALGVMPELEYEDGEATLEPGESLFLYSDGITEAFSRDGREYGEDRLRRVLAANAGLSAEALLGAVLADVRRFAAGADQADDMTTVVLRNLPGLRGQG